MIYLAADNKVRSLKVLELNRNHWIVQNFAVGGAHCFDNFRRCLVLHPDIADLSQRNVAVRLNRDGLIKFGREGEIKGDHIACMNAIALMSFLKSWFLPRRARGK